MIKTTVRGVLCAAHRDLSTGTIHGHTWTVWARFENPEDAADAVVFAELLANVLARWDHAELPDGLARGGRLAREIGRRLLISDYVRIERLAEGIIAEWWR